MLQKLSIRTQLIGIIVVTSMLALVVAGATLFIAEIQRSREALSEELISLAHLLGDRSSATLVFLDNKTARENLSALSGLEKIGSACLFNKQGAMFAEFNRLNAHALPCVAQLPIQKQFVIVEGEIVHVQVPVILGEDVIGAIQINSTSAPLLRQLAAQTLLLVTTMGGALVVAVLLSLKLQRVISRPLAQVRDVANAIVESGNYGLRAPNLGQYELGQLAAAFNRMLLTLHERNEKLVATEEMLRRQIREFEESQLLRKSAEAANIAKSAFLAKMSHELRTPLNAILGYAQILQLDKMLDKSQIDALSVIQQSGEHLLTLINDVLDFAKIEAGKLELYLTEMSLPRLLRVVVEMIEVKAAQKDLDFRYDLAPGLPEWVRADEERLRQVLLNLLSNAVKFTDRGMVGLCVSRSAAGRIRFEVRDSGIGIDSTQLDAIFVPFEQAGELRRRVGGTGLGLAISRQFVQLMGGEILVESRVGEGSTFWFELDLPVIESKNMAVPDPGAVGYEGPRKKILVVDDVVENRAVVVDMLDRLDFETAEAENGADGLKKAQALKPDLILMDLVMPEMDGLEAMRRLREQADFKEVPIIALSARVSADDQQDSLMAGANAFLSKPIDYRSLLAQIAALLDLSLIYEPRQPTQVPENKDTDLLVAPPEDEIENLYLLARQGDMQHIVRWAGRLDDLDQRYRPFANHLRMLAKGYQSKAILNLAKRYLNRKA